MRVRLMICIFEQAALSIWVDAESLGFGKLLNWREPLHESRTRQLLDGDIIHITIAVVQILLVIVFVSVEVHTARNVCLQ